MKKIRIIILLMAFCQLAIAQTYEPQILILTPNEITVEKGLRKEVEEINEKIKSQTANQDHIKNYLTSDDYLNQPLNLQKMIKAEIEFSKHLNFFSQVSFISEQYLSYRFFERFPNQLILLSDQKSDKKAASLRKVVNNEELQYILNFPSIEFYTSKSIPHSKISIQLFDRSTGTTLLEDTYNGDWYNPGFEFACQDSTLSCTINNALSQALDDIIRVVASSSPTLNKERQLAYDRFHMLLENYLTGEVNNQILNDAIPESDSTINLSDCYQTMIDENQSKFLAFFIRQVSPQNFKQFTENKTDQNIQILTEKDVGDEGFLDEVPQTYAYVVKGVKYEDKWFYEKSNVTYFQPESFEQGKKEYFNNLQKWNFFQPETTEFNPDFWETSQFEKVRDLRQDPDWEKHKDMYTARENNNRPFIGQYEIVAKNLRKAYQKFENEFQESRLTPELKRLISENDDFIDYFIPKEGITAVFPSDFSVVLSPILFKYQDGVERIIYLVFFNDEIFQWTYPELKEFKGARRFYRSFLKNEIEHLTNWNFSFDTLNDFDFWNNYVIKKENGEFSFLQKL